MLATLLQGMIEEEFAAYLGARPHERTPTCIGWCNGHRERQCTTHVGTFTLRIPRDRAGEFAPSLFARYQRSEHDLAEMRRTRVIRIFPNAASLVRLGTALGIERNEQWLTRRYVMPEPQEETLYQGKVRIRRSAQVSLPQKRIAHSSYT